MKTKTVLKWRNKFSGEEGFVCTVSQSKGYFTNTFEAVKAKSYRSMKEVQKDLDLLLSFGEFDNNYFWSDTVVG
jgi:hypothetical protein